MNPGSGIVDTAIVVAVLLLCAAVLLTVIRLLRGPGTLDRIVALDVFVLLIVVAAALYIAYYRDGSNIPLLAAVALIGFVGSVAVARLTVRRERHR